MNVCGDQTKIRQLEEDVWEVWMRSSSDRLVFDQLKWSMDNKGGASDGGLKQLLCGVREVAARPLRR